MTINFKGKKPTKKKLLQNMKENPKALEAIIKSMIAQKFADINKRLEKLSKQFETQKRTNEQIIKRKSTKN